MELKIRLLIIDEGLIGYPMWFGFEMVITLRMPQPRLPELTAGQLSCVTKWRRGKKKKTYKTNLLQIMWVEGQGVEKTMQQQHGKKALCVHKITSAKYSIYCMLFCATSVV